MKTPQTEITLRPAERATAKDLRLLARLNQVLTEPMSPHLVVREGSNRLRIYTPECTFAFNLDSPEILTVRSTEQSYLRALAQLLAEAASAVQKSEATAKEYAQRNIRQEKTIAEFERYSGELGVLMVEALHAACRAHCWSVRGRKRVLGRLEKRLAALRKECPL